MDDNLGFHYIGGFTENFSKSAYICRYCTITREMFEKKSLFIAELRTPDSYNSDVKCLSEEVTSCNGIKSSSPFNNLERFHVA